ncbi:hypothetical protein [Bradyrhizobium sp.]|uniref:hypothetical protein n=1 Tax=Bradyrhizobium sp. TaxID=376 RepID=UPI00260AF012|nr:hypothetical protein [Bradyrhizobium sp.]
MRDIAVPQGVSDDVRQRAGQCGAIAGDEKRRELLLIERDLAARHPRDFDFVSDEGFFDIAPKDRRKV